MGGLAGEASRMGNAASNGKHLFSYKGVSYKGVSYKGV